LKKRKTQRYKNTKQKTKNKAADKRRPVKTKKGGDTVKK